MEQALRIEDVIEKEFYVDRHGASHPNKRDGKSIYFINRVEDLFLGVVYDHYGAEIDREEFLQAYESINELVVQLPRGLSKDSFRKNWVWNESGNTVAVDFGTLRLLPPQLELANLLEGCNDNVSERDISRLVKKYVDLRRMDCNKTIEYDSFQGGYFPCAVQRHLELVGYNELGYLDPPKGLPNRKAENAWQIEKARYNLIETLNHHPDIEKDGMVLEVLDRHLTDLEGKVLS